MYQICAKQPPGEVPSCRENLTSEVPRKCFYKNMRHKRKRSFNLNQSLQMTSDSSDCQLLWPNGNREGMIASLEQCSQEDMQAPKILCSCLKAGHESVHQLEYGAELWELLPPQPTRSWKESFNILRDQWSDDTKYRGNLDLSVLDTHGSECAYDPTRSTRSRNRTELQSSKNSSRATNICPSCGVLKPCTTLGAIHLGGGVVLDYENQLEPSHSNGHQSQPCIPKGILIKNSSEPSCRGKMSSATANYSNRRNADVTPQKTILRTCGTERSLDNNSHHGCKPREQDDECQSSLNMKIQYINDNGQQYAGLSSSKKEKECVSEMSSFVDSDEEYDKCYTLSTTDVSPSEDTVYPSSDEYCERPCTDTDFSPYEEIAYDSSDNNNACDPRGSMNKNDQCGISKTVLSQDNSNNSSQYDSYQSIPSQSCKRCSKIFNSERSVPWYNFNIKSRHITSYKFHPNQKGKIDSQSIHSEKILRKPRDGKNSQDKDCKRASQSYDNHSQMFHKDQLYDQDICECAHGEMPSISHSKEKYSQNAPSHSVSRKSQRVCAELYDPQKCVGLDSQSRSHIKPTSPLSTSINTRTCSDECYEPQECVGLDSQSGSHIEPTAPQSTSINNRTCSDECYEPQECVGLDSQSGSHIESTSPQSISINSRTCSDECYDPQQCVGLDSQSGSHVEPTSPQSISINNRICSDECYDPQQCVGLDSQSGSRIEPTAPQSISINNRTCSVECCDPQQCVDLNSQSGSHIKPTAPQSISINNRTCSVECCDPPQCVDLDSQSGRHIKPTAHQSISINNRTCSVECCDPPQCVDLNSQSGSYTKPATPQSNRTTSHSDLVQIVEPCQSADRGSKSGFHTESTPCQSEVSRSNNTPRESSHLDQSDNRCSRTGSNNLQISSRNVCRNFDTKSNRIIGIRNKCFKAKEYVSTGDKASTFSPQGRISNLEEGASIESTSESIAERNVNGCFPKRVIQSVKETCGRYIKKKSVSVYDDTNSSTDFSCISDDAHSDNNQSQSSFFRSKTSRNKLVDNCSKYSNSFMSTTDNSDVDNDLSIDLYIKGSPLHSGKYKLISTDNSCINPKCTRISLQKKRAPKKCAQKSKRCDRIQALSPCAEECCCFGNRFNVNCKRAAWSRMVIALLVIQVLIYLFAPYILI